MKKYIVILFFAMLISSCQMSQTSNTASIVSNLSYFRDSRTGLCFAAVNSMSSNGYTVTSITWVPATDSVLALIKK